MAKFEKAFSDWPHMTMLRDGGIHLTGKYVSPLLDSSAGVWFSLLAVPVAFAAAAQTGNGGTFIVVLVLAVICWYLFLRSVTYAIFGKKLNLKIYPDHVALPGFFGARNYSRSMPIEFRVERHGRAIKETGQHRIYRDAIEVVMQYGEKRIPLAEMPEKDIEKAQSLVIRLQNVCESIDMARSISGGTGKLKPAASGDFGPVPDIR